jgi:hypothetical protein
MSFLENLENTVKAMESRVERDPAQIKREEAARKAAQEALLAAAPFAEALKISPYTNALLGHCRTVGHSLRTVVRVTWIDSTLRLDARNTRLELDPTPKGIRATCFEEGSETWSEIVDLKGDPKPLVTRWLKP